MTATNKQTIISHLEDLRWVFIRAVVYLMAACIISFFFAEQIIEIIKLPAKDVITNFFILKPTDSVVIYMKTILYGGFVIAFLPIIYEFVNFIKPALQKEQISFVLKWTAFSVILFLAGTLFAYFLILPVAVKFLTDLAQTLTASSMQVSFNAYISFVLMLLLCGGIIFQIPLLCAALTILNIISPFVLRKFRKEMFFGLCVFAAVITPTTDVFSMTLFVAPMIVLYELGIIISDVIYKRKKSETEMLYDGGKYD
ncbi:MAG: twin-arginine translocase subunit TatC [Endomicrobiaceae bacterium]|jgi:sec-independent protein translocase protein TatC|nr:twin-arginine translocase subunit TatC [Endomicrobiaceae bacterium]MDD3730716.1 twin-arginine translocase subunit TatC [Endomicrobiaceae bacterium]MDD4165928.1 twin-arginine translocase subunit TatC [Endomicrobiaceae bacterium]